MKKYKCIKTLIKKFIKRIRYYFSHKSCYNRKQLSGKVVFGMCCGEFGGDVGSGYISYQCMDCPYLML